MVVTLVGKMDSSAVDELLRCKAEIAKFHGSKFILFYCREVDTISGDAIGAFTQIQLEIRARHWEVNICSLRPTIKEKLLNMGVVRAKELSNNMREALLGFLTASAGGTKR